MKNTIGYVVGGGLREGFRIRLTVPADTVQEGSFVVCDSGRYRYYGLVTDFQLGASDPRYAESPGDRIAPAVAQALLGKTLFTDLAMYPTLMLDRGPELGGGLPVLALREVETTQGRGHGWIPGGALARVAQGPVAPAGLARALPERGHGHGEAVIVLDPRPPVMERILVV